MGCNESILPFEKVAISTSGLGIIDLEMESSISDLYSPNSN